MSVSALPAEPIPATVLVGFLGSGKTTLLNELLSADKVEKTAVIVNDFSQINVDAKLVRQASEHLVEMSNGCICCTLRQDLVDELAALSAVPGLQRIVIESTGIGEPLPIAQAFHMGELPELVRLEEIVTVVDSGRFWADFERSDTIEDAEGNPIEAPLAPLLVDQLEYTNVVLLNKADRSTPAELDRLEGFVRGLNPSAKIYRTVRCRIEPALVRGTGLYDYEIGPETEAWEAEWVKDGSEAEEYGFNTFTYFASEPFRHEAFMALFDDWDDSILRAKGFVRFVDHDPIGLSVVRDSLELTTFSLAGELDERGEQMPPELDESWADEPIEIVFIGQRMPIDRMVERLDACLASASALSS